MSSEQPERREQVPAAAIVALPSCMDCRRQATPYLPLTQLPDGNFVCPDCERRRARIAAGATAQVPQRPKGRHPAPPDSSYALLDLTMDATSEEISTTLRTQMRYWAERQVGDERAKALEMRAKLREASGRFRTPESRREYDDELRAQMRDERRTTLAEHKVRPLEDWPGRQVSSMKDLIDACEINSANWRIGESKLASRELLLWARYAMGDEDTVQAIEEVLQLRNLSEMRRLNDLLYRIDPDRPFQAYTQPGAFEVVPAERRVSTVAEFVEFADSNWDLAVRHLYYGELVTWLGSQVGLGTYRGQLYYTVSSFYDAVCRRFAGSPYEGVGLEALLEFLDRDLPLPQIAVTFDHHQGSYSLNDWDGELPHAPVTLTITNTTRGFYAGQIELVRSASGSGSLYPWVDFVSLPLAATRSADGTPVVAGTSGRDLIKQCILKGKETQRYTLHLGYFEEMPQGVTLSSEIVLARYEASPSEATRATSYPLTLRLMRFRQGYRAKLWASGLRGSLPGALLDGGGVFAAMSLIFLLGLLFAPQSYWGFFSPEQDFVGNHAWPALLDVGLTAVLRPFFLSIAVFGFTLPLLAGLIFAVCGAFIGLRRGHTKFSVMNDAHAHRVLGNTLSWCIWIASASLVLLDMIAPNISDGVRNPLFTLYYYGPAFLHTYDLNNPAFYPGQPALAWSLALLAVIAPGIAMRVVTRLLITARTRLYAAVAARWDALLRPDGKG